MNRCYGREGFGKGSKRASPGAQGSARGHLQRTHLKLGRHIVMRGPAPWRCGGSSMRHTGPLARPRPRRAAADRKDRIPRRAGSSLLNSTAQVPGAWPSSPPLPLPPHQPAAAPRPPCCCGLLPPPLSGWLSHQLAPVDCSWFTARSRRVSPAASPCPSGATGLLASPPAPLPPLPLLLRAPLLPGPCGQLPQLLLHTLTVLPVVPPPTTRPAPPDTEAAATEPPGARTCWGPLPPPLPTLPLLLVLRPLLVLLLLEAAEEEAKGGRGSARKPAMREGRPTSRMPWFRASLQDIGRTSQSK